jgi:hypothetical protein
MRETRSVFGGTDLWQRTEWALGLLSLISSCFAISVVVFIRKDFGERYLGWLNLAFGYTVVANFMFLGGIVGSFLGWGGGQLMFLFWIAFIAMSAYHRREINRKNKAAVEWHSMYMGTSILPLPLSREIVHKFAEPGLVFLLGHLLGGFSGQVGIWLQIAAGALFVNNHIVYYQQRQAILDMRDAEIEARYLSKALSGAPSNETGGLMVAESAVELMRTDADLKAAFGGLAPELKDVLDAAPANSGEKAAG